MPPATLPTPADVASRTLYSYASWGIAGSAGGEPLDQEDVAARTLYAYVTWEPAGHPSAAEPLDPDDVLARTLYLYLSTIHDRDPSDIAARSLYGYVAWTEGELFPWIEKIVPTEALPGQQIAIYGDGFGDTQLQEGSIVRLGSPVDPTAPGPGTALGVVSWASRSPGLYPANSGTPTEPAIVATVPDPAESGMISVEQTT